MDWTRLISSDPAIVHSAVCFAGTRIPLSVVLDNLAEGAAVDDILRQYPELRAEHVQAALAYAAELARERLAALPQ